MLLLKDRLKITHIFVYSILIVLLLLFIMPFAKTKASSPATYYVATNGNDSWGNGSINQPFKSVQRAINLMVPGDTVIIRGGTYQGRADINSKNGNSSAYFSIKGYPGETVLFDGNYASGLSGAQAFNFYNSSYWCLDNLEITRYTGGGVYLTSGSNNIIMSHLKIHDLNKVISSNYGTAAILAEGAQNCTVKNCNIYNVGILADKPLDHGLYIGYGCSNWIIDSNRISNNSGAGIHLYGDPYGGKNCVISNNMVFNNHVYGIVLGSHSITNNVNNNFLFGNRTSDIYLLESSTQNTFTNNLFGSMSSIYNVIMSDTGSFNNTFTSNDYYKNNNIVISHYDTALNFNQWKSTGQETNGTFSNYCSFNLGQGFTQGSKSYNYKRLNGLSRYETSIAIAEEFNSGKVDNVIVVSGENFPDALSGSVLAKKLNCPILLASSYSSENTPTINYIKNHLNQSGNVFLLGGTSAISETFEQQVRNIGFNNINRLSGADRYKTNKTIIDYMNYAKGTPVIISYGENFADALSISSISAIKNFPIVLTDSSSLSQEAKDILTAISPSTVYIVGGTGVVRDSVKEEIKNSTGLLDNNVIRISGADRYTTSINIAKYFNLNSKYATFAYGENFPDALSGSILAAKLNAPIILVNEEASAQKTYLDSTSYSNLIIYGGKGVVKYPVLNQILK